MHVLVKVAEHKNFVIVAHRLTLEELLGLFEGCLVLLDLVGLCIENEAVRDPAVVTSEDKNL